MHSNNGSNYNVPPSSQNLQCLLSETSCWDLIVAKINQQMMGKLEPNDTNKEKASFHGLQQLLCEIDQTLSNLQLLLMNCCSISFTSETPPHSSPCILDDHSMYVGEHLSKYLGSVFAKNNLEKQDTANHYVKIAIQDVNKIRYEILTTSIRHIPQDSSLITRNNDLDDAKFVEELLFKMEPESKVISSTSHISKSDNVKINCCNSTEMFGSKHSSKIKLGQVESKPPTKCHNHKKSRKKQRKTASEQPCLGPPPPPVIREDGKKVYRKQKVISGYFTHYPISEDEYNKVIERGEPFTCPPCQRQFKHRRSWEHHLNGRCLGMPLTKPNWYKRDGKFFCSHEACTDSTSNRGWTTSYMVWVHFYRVHSPGGQLPHKCDLCDKSFAKIAQLRIHKESKHNINRKVYVLKTEGLQTQFRLFVHNMIL